MHDKVVQAYYRKCIRFGMMKFYVDAQNWFASLLDVRAAVSEYQWF